MLLDTSGLLCRHHKPEPFHDQARMLYKQARNRLIHNYVLAEFVALATIRRLPRMPVLTYLNDLKNNYNTRWGSYPDMMGASTYDGTYIAAKSIENAGTLTKADIRQALVDLKMPQVIQYMKDDTISFSKDFRESQFDLWMEQLYYNTTIGETRPTVVWPDNIKTKDFVLPDWYKPGSP